MKLDLYRYTHLVDEAGLTQIHPSCWRSWTYTDTPTLLMKLDLYRYTHLVDDAGLIQIHPPCWWSWTYTDTPTLLMKLDLYRYTHLVDDAGLIQIHPPCWWSWTYTDTPTLLMKLDLPTLGKPQMRSVRVLGSMDGRRDRCCLTCSRYDRLCPCRFITVHILQQTVSTATIGPWPEHFSWHTLVCSPRCLQSVQDLLSQPSRDQVTN